MMDYNCVHSFKMWETMKYYNILFKASFLDKNMERDASLKELLKTNYEYVLTDKFLHIRLNEEAAKKIEDLFLEILEEGKKTALSVSADIATYADWTPGEKTANIIPDASRGGGTHYLQYRNNR